MKKKSVITWVAIISCLSALLLFSGCKEKHRDGHHAFVLDYVEDVLDLTQEQKELLVQYEAEISEKVKEVKANHKDLHTLAKQQLAAEQIDVALVKSTIEEQRQKMDEIIDLAVDRFAAFHSELTPAQKSKLVSKIEKFEKYHWNDD